VFTVLPAVTYSTLKPELRNEGAAFNALVRSLGMSVGISLMQIYALRDSIRTHSRLVERVRPGNTMLDFAMPSFDSSTANGIGRIIGEITRQATVVGYVDAFALAGVISFALIPTVLFMRVRRNG